MKAHLDVKRIAKRTATFPLVKTAKKKHQVIQSDLLSPSSRSLIFFLQVQTDKSEHQISASKKPTVCRRQVNRD